ncbi:hypothetical protein B0J12DRAFT_157464 [Macrophomina phaseolina]|uniref:Beta/gamma crystallin n=1 Tax=Macrophomina phaseolina TaxID=35725 RepID=A0ABQ8GRE6_9PEZI|nr:hypothetical protein B0J12DRAFT_157464 [Macrophomina phaseolina]
MRPTLSVSAAAILSLALSTTLVAAAPFTEEVVIKKTMNAGLYLCENAGFKGYCVHFTTPFGQCNTITDRFPPGDRGVSAAGADTGNWCTLYSKENCHGEELQVYHPGYENLSPLGWNDRVRSYNCAAI